MPRRRRSEGKGDQSILPSVIRLDLNHVAGLSEQVERIRNLIELPSTVGNIPNCFEFIDGILLYGIAGTGKSMVIKGLVSELTPKFNFLNVNGDMLSSNFFKKATETVYTNPKSDSISSPISERPTVEITYKSKLDRLFKRAIDCCPSIIILDDLHRLCPNKKNLTEKESNFFKELITFFDQKPANKRIIIIAATNQIDLINVELRRVGRFQAEIEFPVPTQAKRFDILKKIFSNNSHSLTNDDLKYVSDTAHGYTGGNLREVYRWSSVICLERIKEQPQEMVLIALDDVKKALKLVKPTAMKEIVLEIPEVYWKDVGGMDDVKELLITGVIQPLKHLKTYKTLGLNPSIGVLMFGPPGCSKTMIVKALATESRLNFFSIKGPELLNKYVGESEKAVREIFRKARQASPAIVFFDEIDVLAPERRASGSEDTVVGRILTQLLTEIDGIENLEGVTIVAATNFPEKIDKALLRPGRLGSIIYVRLPDYNTRLEIFKILSRKHPFSSEVEDNFTIFAQKTEGYSGAEIVELCHEAGKSAFKKNNNATFIDMSAFDEAFTKVKARTSKESLARYDKFYCNFCQTEEVETNAIQSSSGNVISRLKRLFCL